MKVLLGFIDGLSEFPRPPTLQLIEAGSPLGWSINKVQHISDVQVRVPRYGSSISVS